MIKVYARLVYLGIKAIEEVPLTLRLAVELLVEEMRQSNNIN